MARRLLPGSAKLVVSASAMTTLGTLPVFLLSAQSVFVRRELDFDERQLGLAVSAFFAAAAVAALLGGGIVDRLGQRGGTVLAGLTVAAGGFGTAVLVESWAALLATMVVLGIANAACQVTSNLTMARGLPPGRRGLGFGIKQAAIPLAIALSGIAVPALAEGPGWRWSFLITGAGGLVLAVWGLGMAGDRGTGSAKITATDRPPLAPLMVTMIAVALASAAANSFGSFLPAWAFEVGISPTQAGVLMTAGSSLNIAIRILSGHLADRRHGRNLPVVAIQMTVGGLALLGLSFAVPSAVVIAGLVAFAVGWTWPGLLLYAVVRVGRDAPARASGVVQAGAFVGGATGPALFGTLVNVTDYQTAWQVAAVVFVAAAALITVARRLFIADLVARPPTTPLRYGGTRTTQHPPEPP